MDITDYVRLGYDLIPLLGKKPLTKWKEPVPVERTIELVNRFRGNIGFVTGRSRIVVADCDDEEATEYAMRSLPVTNMRAKTSRGMHLYYRAPPEFVPIVHGFRGKAIDILAGNSYAAKREWLTEVLPANELPVFPSDLIKPKEEPKYVQRVFSKDREQLIRWAEETLARIPREEGQRDLALFRAACVLIQKYNLTPEEAYPILVGFNLTINPPFPDQRVRYKLSEAIRLKEKR